jgi:hypothetical protein
VAIDFAVVFFAVFLLIASFFQYIRMGRTKVNTPGRLSDPIIKSVSSELFLRP